MKKILIISNMLNSGGVEVSLLNFIKELKKQNENLYIRLLLLRRKGTYLEEFSKLIDIDEINFNDQCYNPAFVFSELPTISQKCKRFIFKIFEKINLKNINKLLAKHAYDYTGYWDLAIDFHGYGFFGTMFLAKQVNAKIKCSFIHDENMKWMNKNMEILNDINAFLCVSNSCINKFKILYPMYNGKVYLFRNILDREKILSNSIENSILSNEPKFKILTIGRLVKQKGYDILLKTAEILIKNSIDFKWYIIGEGNLKNKITKKIKNKKLDNNVFLLGMKKNPYPYIKKCDLYVQTSRHEGYGIAIAEARILEKPIVASKLKCIEEQITDGINGSISKIDPNEFAKKIIEIYDSKQLRKKYIKNLEKQNLKSKDDISLIFKFLEGDL